MSPVEIALVVFLGIWTLGLAVVLLLVSDLVDVVRRIEKLATSSRADTAPVGYHVHEPYVFNSEEIRDMVPDGFDGRRVVMREKVVGALEHHACRLCSEVLD